MRLRPALCVLIVTLAPALPVCADQRLSDLVLQIQRLQEEVQQLRGKIELQQYDIEILKRQQRDQYMDLDARLRGQAGAAPAEGSASSAAGAAPVPPATASATPGEEKQAYYAALDLLKQRHYEDAARGFEDLLARYPRGQFADNACYWLGEAQYVTRHYSAALTQFQRVLVDFPLSPKVPGSMLKIGYVHYDQGDWKQARKALLEVAAKFPGTDEARLAESRLERMKREGH